MSLLTLIIICYVLTLIQFFVKGICLYTVACLIITTMFALKYLNVFIKSTYMLIADCLCLFFSCAWQFLFGEIAIAKMIICAILRLAVFCIAKYDEVANVYFTVERKRKDDE